MDGVRIHYLDWGGDGPPLVMIHGICDNPHIFDDLADLLRGRFRLVAYARRGHGQSDAPDSGYDLGAYVRDLEGVLDALGIQRTSLLGWSMGGNEITRFAVLYPDRVEKLVYLESGYDWSDPGFLKEFVPAFTALGPDDAALRSLDAFRRWNRATWLGLETPWTLGLESYLRDGARLDEDGAVQPVPTDRVVPALLASLASPPRDYRSVQAPALAVYCPKFFPDQPGNPRANSQAQAFNRFMDAFRAASIERIRRELKNPTVRHLAHQVHMSIGCREPSALAAMITEFLTR